MPNGPWSRLDYIAVPLHWSHLHMESQVLLDIESLQNKDDHRPVLLSCHFCRTTSDCSYFVGRAAAVRPSTLLRHQPDTVERLRSLPSCSWQVPVDQHYAQLVEHWHSAVEQLQTPTEESPQQPFLTPATMQLVRTRQAFRQYLRAEKVEAERRLKLIAIAAFIHHTVGSVFLPAARDAAERWLRAMDSSIATAVSALHWLGRRLRVAVATDRRRYLDSLAEQAASHDFRSPKELYRAIRKAFPAACAARRTRFQPLPMLVGPDGQTATTPEERAAAWREHFSQQESGITVSPQDYAAGLRQDKATARPVPFELHSVPTLNHIEQVVLGLRMDKAAGPDRLTGETLRLHVPTTTRQLFPVVAKTALRVQEPSMWRGGELFILAKRAGAAMTCEAFRSIMVTSVAAKVMHRCIRDELKPTLLAVQPPLQGGVRPGLGIEAPILAVKTFAALSDALGAPWSVTFVDLQAAFYSVIRQTLVDNPDTDAAFLRMLHTLQVPGYALTELKDHLHSVAELPRQGVTAHTAAMVQDLFTGTWFRLTGNPELVRTHRASRPGDPAADILFSFCLSALFRRLELALDSQGLKVHVPAPTVRPSWAGAADTSEIGNPAWADDFTVLQSGNSPSDMLQRTQAGLGVLIALANSLGMRMKFGPEKTAIVMSEAARKSVEASFRRGPEGEAVLPFQDFRDATWHSVPVVSAYRHLGGVFTSPLTPVPDLYYRFSRVSGDVQAQLHPYEVLHQARKPTPPLAIARARAAYLAKLLHEGPELLLTLLVDHWLLHPKTAWLGQLDSDFQLVSSYLPHMPAVLAAASGMDSVVPQLLTAVREARKWWINQVDKAISIQQTELEICAELLQQYRAPTPALPAEHMDHDVGVPSAEGETRPYRCATCGAQFLLRKHMCLHMARAHGLLSPARHFAITEWCTACHRHYGCLRQVQQHLKASPKCLRRCVDLHPPLTIDDIRRLELPLKQRDRGMRHGAWKLYQGRVPTKAPLAYGPPMPTAAERFSAEDALGEDIPLTLLCPSFTPKESTIAWIEHHIAGGSREGPRQATVRYWQRRPATVLSSQPRFHQNSRLARFLDAPS
eukprot:s375_g16.t1